MLSQEPPLPRLRVSRWPRHGHLDTPPHTTTVLQRQRKAATPPTEPERIRSEFSPTHHPYMHCINSTHRNELCSTSVFNTMVEGVIGHVGSTDTETCLHMF